VIRLGAMGDVIRTLPAVSALRAGYPSARISWLVEPHAASLLEAQPWIDEVLVFPRPQIARHARAGRWLSAGSALRRFLAELRARRFDLVLDFHSILKSALLAFASGAPVRVAYARPYGREGAWLLASERARLVPGPCSRFVRNAALLEFLGLDARPDPEPLRVPPAVASAMRRALGGGRPVALHPGTSDGTPYKRWTPEGYAEVASALAEACGAEVVVTVGPARDDRRLADAIVAAAGGAARLAPETRSLLDLAALFAASRLYVGGDSGPMHVASLVGTPVVQLLGPTDPVENAPFAGTPSRTLRVPVACAPCRRGCAAATCMRLIRPDRVVEAARQLLGEPPAAAGGAPQRIAPEGPAGP
jgi:ADP-heptose:LPS heptosyltransferase